MEDFEHAKVQCDILTCAAPRCLLIALVNLHLSIEAVLWSFSPIVVAESETVEKFRRFIVIVPAVFRSTRNVFAYFPFGGSMN